MCRAGIGRSRKGVFASREEAAGKVNSRNPAVGAAGKSDGNIVPKKSANKGEQPSAERMEGRAPAEGNPQHEATDRVQDRGSVFDAVERVRQRAMEDKQSEFANLFHLLKVPLLRKAYFALNRDASPGLDGVSQREIRCQIPKVGAVCGSPARTDLRGEGLRMKVRKSFYRNVHCVKTPLLYTCILLSD